MKNIKIKQAKLEDLSRVVYITKFAYRHPYKKNALITKSHESADLRDDFMKKRFFALVAICDNKIVGAVRYRIVKDDVYVYKLAILKLFRNKGIGAALMQAVEKKAKMKKSKKILLDCAKEKGLAEYYKKLGFKIDIIKKHQDHHDVYMSKIL